MVKAVSVRLDDDALRALARLEASGLTRSQAIRSALIETADRRQRTAALRDEAAAVAADADDRREMAEVASLMEDLRDPW
jgi:predicted transcriptional regulator